MSWPTAPLGDVCNLVGGGTPSRTQPAYFGGDIPWATPTDVTALRGRMLIHTKECITQAGLQASSARLVDAGTVLLTSRATIGFAAIAQVPMATNQGFANFLCGPRILPEFLAYWLEIHRQQLILLAGGTTFKEITKGTLRKLPVPVPPLEEQRRIVDILDRAASIRRLRRQAQETARQIIPALFNTMFGDPGSNPMGWRIRPLGEAIGGFEGGRSLQADAESSADDVLRILKISAVTSGSFRPEEAKPAPQGYVPPSNHFVRDGDLLISRANTAELVGATALVRNPSARLLLPDKIWRVLWRDLSPVTPEFLLAWFKQPSIRAAMSRLASGTSASMRNISQGRLSTVNVILPPLEVQRRFGVQSACLERLMADHRAGQNIERTLHVSLQASLFRA